MKTASEYRRRVFAEAKRLGWRLVRHTGHSVIWRHDELHLQIALSKSPSDHREIQNDLAMLRRVTRPQPPR